MLKMFEGVRIRPVSWAKAACYACALVLIYYSTLKELFFQWSGDDYSYCWLIPFVVLYLIWEKRAELAGLPSSPTWQGLAPFILGICFFWLGDLGGEYTLLDVSLWLIITGLVWMHIGRQKMQSIAFAFMVMPAMFPLPNYINTRLTIQAKMISSQLGVWMLHLAGMSAYREGNIIDLGFTQLQVVDACSGLRYILPLIIMALLLAYWFKAHIWKRAVLFLSSIPLSILMNSFRIALTGILYSAIGSQAAEGFFHGFSGWLVFMVAVPVFIVEMLVLKKMPPKEVKRGDGAMFAGGVATTMKTLTTEKQDNDGLTVKAFLQPQFMLGIAILFLTFGFSHGIEFRQKVPIAKPFSQFPMQVGQWNGTSEPMAPEFRDALNFSDYLMVDFTNSRGNLINFYVAYYQDQRKGESIHSPETCLPMSGWTFEEAGDAVVPLAGGKSLLPVNRAYMQKAGTRELAYYWFPQRGRILTKLYQLKLFTFWDSLTEQRTDGALVRVITPVNSSESLQDAENRLQAFTRQIVPILDRYIPGKSLNPSRNN